MKLLLVQYLAIGLAAATLVGCGPLESHQSTSIVVLQFKDLTEGHGPDVKEITSELVRQISTILKDRREFIVTGERDTKHDAALEYSYLVTGTVQSGVNSIRVVIELTNSQNGEQIWASVYATRLGDWKSTARQIAQEIVTALHDPFKGRLLLAPNT